MHDRKKEIANGQCGETQWRGDNYCKDASGALVKVYIGPVLPFEAQLDTWTFELCQDGKCVENGGFWGANTAFGIGTKWVSASHRLPSAINKENYFIKARDVTRVLFRQGWTTEKPLIARMTSYTKQSAADKHGVENLPEPVVIVGKWSQIAPNGGDWWVSAIKDGGAKLTLNPNEDRSHYGNLLDEWSG